MIFYVWMHNRVDCRDDDVIKVRAKSRTDAKKIAKRLDDRDRFSVGTAYRPKEFRKRDPGWYSLISSHKPDND